METVVTPSPAFWRGRRVLVTGHTGFKGAWMVLWLQHLGAEVTGLALDPPSSPSLHALAGACGVTDLRGDVRDAGLVAAAVASTRPEVVLHLAAQALVRPSYVDPVATYATNVMGTVHVLEALRQSDSVRLAINVTSDKCYENREWSWAYRESEPMGGYDPYSSSKGCAELVTSAYRRSFFSRPGGPALASARAGNVIGGGDWALDRIVPDCVRAFVRAEPVRIRNPHAVRPWQHVLEPLSGYLLLAEALWRDGPAHAEGWNFGPGEDDARPVSFVVDTMVRLWGEGAAWEIEGTPQPHEATFLKIDPSKARSRLGWRPRLSVAQALAWTVDWYHAQSRGADARSLCLDQIDRYHSLGTRP